MDAALAVLLAYHGDAVELGIISEVARLCDGLENGHAVLAFHLNCAHFTGLAQYREGEVHDLRGHKGVRDEVACDQLVLDGFGQLAAGKSAGLYLADDGEVDGAIVGHGVAVVVAGVARAADVTLAADAVTARGHIEGKGQFGILAGDFDGDLVVGLNDKVFSGLHGIVDTRIEVGEVGHLRACSARGGGEHDEQCRQEL